MGPASDPELPWKYQRAWQSSKISVEKEPTQVSEQRGAGIQAPPADMALRSGREKEAGKMVGQGRHAVTAAWTGVQRHSRC